MGWTHCPSVPLNRVVPGMEIATSRLRIRYFRKEDLEQYAPIVADADVMKFVGGPQSEKEAKNYLAEMIDLSSRFGIGRYAVELLSDHSLIGFCGFRPAGDYLDFGYRYAKSTWGKGIGLEAALAVRKYGLHVLKLETMEAGAAKENLASIKILERMGFKYREELVYEGVPAIRYRDKSPECRPEK